MEPPVQPPTDSSLYRRASAALARTWTTIKPKKSFQPSPPLRPKLPPISHDRLVASLHDEAPSQSQPPTLKFDDNTEQTFLYLAYASNLSASTFQGRRGIRPLAALNVVVPSLTMTFDLAGLPYTEPCFANTAYRTTTTSSPLPPHPPNNSDPNEKSPLISPAYSNPNWPKGLVGVVYEVTAIDYAHIIATEGGGASYHDVLVTCHPLSPTSDTVPAHPETPHFKAHTLYSPISPPGSGPPKDGGRFSRPDPEYAQPSRRYIDLITTGASENSLPLEYRNYLEELQPYMITTQGQRIGRMVFMMTWWPVLKAVFVLNRVFSDERGRSPKWLVRLLGAVFVGVWTTYDGWMKGLFGDGERTIEGDGDGGKEGGGDGMGKRRRKLVKRRKEKMEGREKEGWRDEV
ncbi:MAG: hypothetical protein Q9166_003351 [cf. Caloplaca sp. 2 TL-2023]